VFPGRRRWGERDDLQQHLLRRLLTPCGGLPPPAAADCYRYSLGPARGPLLPVGPRTLEQLEENLAALRDPDLPDGRRPADADARAALYEGETMFRRLVRSV